jgi:DNA (cytosine-5)-methyltransferase 1
VNGLIVDLFAGGGGASVGIEAALGRSVDIAVNHDEVALAVHRANHAGTRHLDADIWEVKPREATGGHPVDLLWASPDCTHFSVAKGDVPRDHGIRSLAWAVVKWAAAVKPRIILLENVREFQGWGPLGVDGRPNPRRVGATFIRWVKTLERYGYAVEWRVLDSADFGAPTRRRRLFVVARRDGQRIVWPDKTHGAGLLPFRTAAECIDWTLPCPSIFERKKPLAEKTLWRIAEGIRRYVIESPRPFIVKVNHGKPGFRGQAVEEPLSTVTATQRAHALVTPSIVEMNHSNAPRGVGDPLGTITTQHNRFNLVAPTLIQTGYGEREGQAARVPGLDKPLGTVVACGQKHALVAAFLSKHYGGVVGHGVEQPIGTVTSKDHHSLTAATLLKLNGECHGAALAEPMPTITASGNHVAEVRAFLIAYYGQGVGQSLNDPARTLTTHDRLGLVTIEGAEYQIADIGMRMLEPHELLRAQFGDFAEGYDLGAARTKADKVRLIGNSVCPAVAQALVAANAGDLVAKESAA